MTIVRADTPSRKSALAPDLRELDERAARAWTERMAVRPIGEGRYAVDAESGATYVVDLSDRSCTCPDYRIRGERCKHLRRVAIEITARRVPPPGKTRVQCDACGAETLTDEDASGPHLCANCALEPGDIVVDRESVRRTDSERASGVSASEVVRETRSASRDDERPEVSRTTRRDPGDERSESPGETANRETGTRLIVQAVTDRRADEVTVPSAGTTVADYPTNEGYPADDPVVEASYVSDLGTERTRNRRYSFPHSRLERADDAALVG